MNFKPALCPSCGGRMQVPDNVGTIKCMYCGIDVIVRDAIRLAGRVKEFTPATAVEKVREFKPFDAKSAKKQTYTMLFILGGMGVLASLCSFSFDRTFGTIIVMLFLLALPTFLANRHNTLAKIQEADEKMGKMTPSVKIIAYKGQCPYCDSSITLAADALGDNCPACQKRIVIRDAKFYSVDTPISTLESKI